MEGQVTNSMKKILIQQILVEEGFFHDMLNDEDDLAFITDTCIPSMRAYAQRHGYDYDLHTTVPDIIYDMPTLDQMPDYKRMRLGFIRYLLLNKYEDYDYIVLYDCDMLMTADAPALPLAPGITTRHLDYYRFSEVDTQHRRILANAGLYIFDKESARRMYDFAVGYIKDIIENKPEWFHDEHVLAHFMDDNLDIPHNDIGDGFNHDASIKTTTPSYVPKKWAYHFIGGTKEMRYDGMIDYEWVDENNCYIAKFGQNNIT